MDVEVFRAATLSMLDSILARPLVLFGQNRQVASGWRGFAAIATPAQLRQPLDLAGVTLAQDGGPPVEQERINAVCQACLDAGVKTPIPSILKMLTEVSTAAPEYFVLLEQALHVG